VLHNPDSGSWLAWANGTASRLCSHPLPVIEDNGHWWYCHSEHLNVVAGNNCVYSELYGLSVCSVVYHGALADVDSELYGPEALLCCLSRGSSRCGQHSELYGLSVCSVVYHGALADVDSELYGLSVCSVVYHGALADVDSELYGLSLCSVVYHRALADVDSDGRVDRREFSIAMYLIKRCLHGHVLPSVLPSSLKVDPVSVQTCSLMSDWSMSSVFGTPMSAVRPLPAPHGQYLPGRILPVVWLIAVSLVKPSAVTLLADVPR